MRLLFITILMSLASISLTAQSYTGSGNYNRVGLQAQYALMDLGTTDFESEGQAGFTAGLTTRGRLYNNFGMVYGLDLVSTKVNIQGRALGSGSFEDMQYDMIGAKLNLLLSYNILGQHLAIDFGPSLLVNSKLKLKNMGQEDNIVKGYASLKATDIQEVSLINPMAVIAITGGFEQVRFTAQYHYGFTNFLGNLNKNNLPEIDPSIEDDFKGNLSVVSFGIALYL